LISLVTAIVRTLLRFKFLVETANRSVSLGGPDTVAVFALGLAP
jgi:hypothetical protein